MKIAVFITSYEFTRNYLETNSFQKIRKNAHLTLVVNGNIELSNVQREQFDEVLQYRDLNKRYSNLLYTLYMLRYRSLSSSFRYRARRQFPNIYWQWIYFRNHSMLRGPSTKEKSNEFKTTEDLIPNKEVRFLVRLLRLIQKFIFGKIRKLLFYFLASRVLFWISSRIIKSLIYRDSRNLWLDSSYDSILIPSSAHEPMVPLLIHEARKQKIRTILLVDNWDNLSSKSILWEKPDLLACWGPQSIDHAAKIQKMNPERCIAIGTPRIDSYFEIRHKPIPANFNFPYILFLGSSLPYNEAEFLERLDNEISKNPSAFFNHKVVYRPHPLRGGWKLVEVDKLQNVQIDPDIVDRYRSGDLRWNRSGVMPPLRNYPSLISNSTIIVTGLSSMIFEGSIFWKKCTVLAFDEPRNLTNPKRIFDEYLHFRGIDSLSNLDLAFSQDEAIKSVSKNLKNPIISDKHLVDEQLRKFIEFDSDGYSTRLSKII